MRAARYAGVPLWELDARPVAYRNLYLAAERAELEAEAQRQRTKERRRRHGKR